MDNSGVRCRWYRSICKYRWANDDLDVIDITGNLNLDAAISNTTSLSVSGTSNLGADVTTTGDQTYSGAAVLSSNVILTTTANGSVYFGSTLDGGYNLNITTHGTGDVTFIGAVGGITPLGDITISTNELNAVAITAGNLNITHTGAGAVTGIIADAAEDNTLALIKAGAGTLTLSANNTFTGDTTISSGDLVVGGSGKLGGGSYGGAIVIASGSTLSYSSSASQTLSGSISGSGDIEKVTSASSTLTISGANTYTGGTVGAAGTIKAGSSYSTGPPRDAFGTGSLTIATGAVLDLNGQTINNVTTISGTGIASTGAIINSNASAATLQNNVILAADSSIGGSNNVTLSGVISGAYNLTKVGSSTYTLSGTNTYSGNTTISAGTITLTGSVNALTDLSIASGATLDLQSTQTFATLDLDGTISNSTGSSALTITGASDIGGSITTSGTQDYEGAITLTGHTTLVSGDQITFDTTVTRTGSETNNLTVATTLQVDGIQDLAEP
jgi:autotransporter-associated beta strand protein